MNGDMVWVPSMGLLGMLMGSDGQVLTVQPFLDLVNATPGRQGETVEVAPNLVAMVWRPAQLIMGGPPEPPPA